MPWNHPCTSLNNVAFSVNDKNYLPLCLNKSRLWSDTKGTRQIDGHCLHLFYKIYVGKTPLRCVAVWSAGCFMRFLWFMLHGRLFYDRCSSVMYSHRLIWVVLVRMLLLSYIAIYLPSIYDGYFKHANWLVDWLVGWGGLESLLPILEEYTCSCLQNGMNMFWIKPLHCVPHNKIHK